ncbi:MAG: hypothetical protein ABFD86_11240 [Bryobacteraceae bacterium]
MLLAAAVFAAQAGPVEFGRKEVESAVAARGLRPGAIRFTTEITSDAAETYRIVPGRIQGGDLRGLMYGLLAAAEQVRSKGRLSKEKGAPATPLRGVRRVAGIGDFEQEWFQSQDGWRDYIRALARNRFNRLNLVFTHSGSEFAPPYPYLLSVPGFPQVRVKGLTAAQRERNLALLRLIASTCAEHAVDFTLGIWEEKARGGAKSAVEGLNAENLGPYSYAAMKQLLAECRAMRCVQLRGGSEGGAASGGKNAFRAVAEAGRRVVLEVDSDAYEAALASGAPVRLPLDYWNLWVGHDTAAARRRAGGTLDLLERPRRYGVFWQIGASGVCSQFAWGDPESARWIIPALTASGSEGFEIDLGRARLDGGAWLPHFLWGRLGYDPLTPEKLWTAASAQEAYRHAGRACTVLAVQPLVQREPVETAARLTQAALGIEQGLARADAKSAGASGVKDVALLARYRARKLVAEDHLAYFDETGDARSLELAKRELRAALAAGENLAELRESLAVDRRQLERIGQRERIEERFGRFDIAFDFGPALDGSAVVGRFRGVAPGTRYTDTRGYGWTAEGNREAMRLPKRPAANLLFGDAIRGQGRQVFRVKTGPGDFTVLLIGPDGKAVTRKLRARNDVVDVVFEGEAWEVAGVIVKAAKPAPPPAARASSEPLPTPEIEHTPPKEARPNRPLKLSVRVKPATNVALIRLHYGPASLREPLKTIEIPSAKPNFTIPAAEVTVRWDLMYYFEVLNTGKGTWLDPDPFLASPYYVVRVGERK